MSIHLKPSRATLFKSLGVVAVAGTAVAGSMATSASAAPSGYTMKYKNLKGHITGPVNCRNIDYPRVIEKFVPFGTHYSTPVTTSRTITCGSGSTVVKAKIEMRGSFQNANNPSLPTAGREYRIHMSVVKNGQTFECGYTKIHSMLVGPDHHITENFRESWSQGLRNGGFTKKCGGSNVSMGFTLTEGWSAP